MKIAFILDEPWDSALTDYAFKIYKLASKEHITQVFCLKGSFIANKVDNASYLKPLRNKKPLNFFIAFLDFYKKLKEFEPRIVITIRGDATFMSCLLKKNIDFKLFRVFGENKTLKSSVKCIDRLILPCEFLKKKVPENTKNVTILKSFIDTERFKFSKEGREKIREEFNLDRKIVFGSVGRLDKVKGFELLIEAFAKANIENSVLFIVGEEKGVKKAELIKIAHNLNLKNVIIITERRSDIVDIMSAFDIGVVSSIDSEVIPRVLFEFLSVGLQIVSTNVGCLNEIAEENGLIVAKPTIDELSVALSKALKDLKNINKAKISEIAQKYKLHLPTDFFSA